MPAGNFFALFDDIASVLDDVAILTKVAAKKTSGVLGDDLALNAEQVAGVKAEREIPVVLAVAKGSAINKIILVPSALLIAALVPKLITPLLMLGGTFLCFEGCEKVLHAFFPKKEEEKKAHLEHIEHLTHSDAELIDLEKQKIKGAIKTDFILSAEIIVITLGTVTDSSFLKQVLVLSSISLLMTIGVYGLVAGIVKLDDLGFHLVKFQKGLKNSIGKIILLLAPKLMKSLSVIGTIAMFLVGGGIVTHGIPSLHLLIEGFSQASPFPTLVSTIGEGLSGLALGLIALGAVEVFKRLKPA